MGRPGNHDPRSFWQADLDEAAGRLVWFVRHYQPDVITTYNAFGGYGHPDHIRTHDVAVRAFDRAGDAAWYPEQLDGTGLETPWAPSKLYEQAMPASVRRRWPSGWRRSACRIVLGAARGRDAGAGRRVRGVRGEDARPGRIDHDVDRHLGRRRLDAKWAAIQRARDPDQRRTARSWPRPRGWREFGRSETYILRESRVESSMPETDLFAGIV